MSIVTDERKDPKGRKLRIGESYDEKSGRYRYTYTNPVTGVRTSVYAWTLTKNDKMPIGKSGKSLREREDEVNAEISNKLNSTKGNQTVYELMKRYIDLKWKDVRESTRKGYMTQLNFMQKESFGKKKIKDVTAIEAEEWFDALHDKKGKNYSTLHTLRGILRPAFAMAKKNRWTLDNPFDFPMNKKRYGGENTRESVTQKDMRRFLDFVRTDKAFSKYFNGFYLLFNTGLRISEFCGLTVADIDFARKVIYVRRQLIRSYDGKNATYVLEETKTANGERIIPMLGDVEKVLKEVIDNRPQLTTEPVVWDRERTVSATKFLWFDKNNNLEVAQHWQNHMRWAVAKFNRTYKDEIPNITPHVCRHTFCSMCATMGMAPKTLQTIMGHSSIAITLDVYTHLEETDLLNTFDSIRQNQNYDFYSLSRVPVTVAPFDDTGELSEPDFEEAADND